VKVLQIVNDFPPERPEAAAWCAYSLSRELIHNGHDVAVFAPSPGSKEPIGRMTRERLDRISVFRVSTRSETESERLRTFIDINTDLAFRACAAEFKPDVVHIHHLHGLSASIFWALDELGIPTVLSAYDYWYICPRTRLLDRDMELCSGPLEGFRCAWCTANAAEERDRNEPSEHNADPPTGSFSLKGLLPLSLKHRIKTAFVPEIDDLYRIRAEIEALRRETDFALHTIPHFVGRYQYITTALSEMHRIIIPSAFARTKLVTLGFPENLVTIAPHRLHGPTATARPGKTSDALRFAYIGEPAAYSGIEVVLRAFAGILPSDASLQVFGPAPDSKYERYLRQLAGAAAVTFRESPAIDRISEILTEVDAVIAPSLWEEVFNPIADESLLAGTPVVASRIGALEEAVEDGVNGLLVEPGNADSLRRKLEMLIANRELLQRLTQGAKRAGEPVAQSHEAIYEEAVASRGSTSGNHTSQRTLHRT
jgi:glycosyltransferase involved in cell wall biosynthesis